MVANKRVWMGFVFGLILLVVLSACGSNGGNGNGTAENGNNTGGNGAAGEGSDKPVKLQVGIWDERMGELVDDTITEFKAAHPNVDVQVTVTPFADYWTKMQTSLAGGSGPDVLMINGPNFLKLASLGLISSLQPFVDKDALDLTKYNEGIVDLYKKDGNLYGLPYFVGSIGMYYNKALFDAAGIDYPDASWTWDDIKEKGKQLTDPAANVYGYVALNQTQQGYYPLVDQAGGYIINEDHTKSGLDLPETQSAIQFMKDLMDAGISPNAQYQQENNAIQMFGSGKAAMITAISSQATTLYDSLGDKLGIAELPAGKQQGSVVHGSSWAINSKTKNPKMAWELIKMLSTKVGQDILAKSGFNIPAHADSLDLWLKSNPSLDLNPFLATLKYSAPYPVSLNTAEWESVMNSAVTEALLGSKPVKEAMDDGAKQMNDILASE